MLRERLQQHRAKQGEGRCKMTAERYFSCRIGLFHQCFAIALAVVGKFSREMPISREAGLNGVGITGLECTGASRDAPVQPTIGM
ncbi:hypothetical protein EAG21025_32840 [Enterobacter asburiae]